MQEETYEVTWKSKKPDDDPDAYDIYDELMRQLEKNVLDF